jgi:eukaryotic-like serine/threonine-protein kinase
MEAPMDWPVIEPLLDALLALPEAEREASLERWTEKQPQLRPVLRSLLAHTEGADALLDFPAIDALHESPLTQDQPATPDPATLASGEQLGVYRIVALIGRGGMGEVYRAERMDGQFEQSVAIKLIRSEAHVSVARFQAERRLLARLDHSGIARLLDGGVHADGRPYMVMELVDGEPLNAWCEMRQASLEQRLALFQQVCEAVAYAHSHLVVHRDLKSSNILVTPEGRTKLLDFGIATLLADGAVNDATRTAHLSLTHAAPEQLTGAAVTTATDVYGLGVTLYDLLCARLPWDVASLPLAAGVRRLLEESLVPPSAAVADDWRISRWDLRGNLDAIVARALRREPRARYPDARALGDDVGRHLNGEPVRAREGARLYMVGSFLRRHWLPTTALLLLFLALAAGFVSTLWQAHAARREAARAETEAAKATAVKDFLLDIFKYSSVQNPGGAAARNVTAGQLLDIGADQIRSQLQAQPEVRGELLETLSSLYDTLGAPDRALALAQERVDALSTVSGRDGHAWAQAQLPLATALIDLGRDSEAKTALGTGLQALDQLSEKRSLLRAQILEKLAYADYDGTSSDRIEGLRLLREALAMLERLAPDSELRGDILQLFGYYAQLDEDYAGAERWKKQYLDFERQQGTDTHGFGIGSAQLELGDVQALAREYADSETNLREAVQVLTKAVGQDHPSTAIAESRLGEMYYRSGRPAEAEPLLVAALASQQLSPQGRSDASETRKTLGLLQLGRGRPATAKVTLNENLKQLAASKDLELRYAVSACALVSVLTAQGAFSEAVKLYTPAIEVFRRHIGEASLGYAGCKLREADLNIALGGPALEHATDIYSQLRARWVPKSGQFPDIYVAATIGLARAELARGHLEAARTASEEALRTITDAPEREFVPDREAQAARVLGVCWTRLGRPDQAQRWLRRAVELRERLDYPDSIWLSEVRIDLAESLLGSGRTDEARQLLIRAADSQRHQPQLAEGFRTQLIHAQQQLQQRRTD